MVLPGQMWWFETATLMMDTFTADLVEYSDAPEKALSSIGTI
jgi:hypothetical protein